MKVGVAARKTSHGGHGGSGESKWPPKRIHWRCGRWKRKQQRSERVRSRTYGTGPWWRSGSAEVQHPIAERQTTAAAVPARSYVCEPINGRKDSFHARVLISPQRTVRRHNRDCRCWMKRTPRRGATRPGGRAQSGLQIHTRALNPSWRCSRLLRLETPATSRSFCLVRQPRTGACTTSGMQHRNRTSLRPGHLRYLMIRSWFRKEKASLAESLLPLSKRKRERRHRRLDLVVGSASGGHPRSALAQQISPPSSACTVTISVGPHGPAMSRLTISYPILSSRRISRKQRKAQRGDPSLVLRSSAV